MQEFDFDLFVIGAGSGGVRTSRIAASLGAKVGIAEEKYYGGTCVNVGCVPKKLFSYAAHYREDFEDSRGYGWQATVPAFNWQVLMDNKNKEISRLNGIYENILNSNNVEIFDGRARLTGPQEVEVNGNRLSAKHIIVAVGGWPWIPDFPGSELALNSNDLFEMEALPDSIVVVGGGYIAVEFASILTRLGCETTLVYRGDKLLRGFDEEVRSFITAEIGNAVKLKLGVNVESLKRTPEAQVEVHYTDGSSATSGAVLYATGRKPNTADLGLDAAGVATTENGAIVVDDGFRTNVESISAVGDVIDRVALTPVALAEGEIVARRLFGGADTQMNYDNIATAVFCHPNIGTVGLSEEQAQERGIAYDVYGSQFRTLRHTLSGRDEKSLVKLLVEQGSDRVIGLHMVGPDAGEIVQGFGVAINCGATKADFDRTVAIHPTLAEEFVTMSTKRG